MKTTYKFKTRYLSCVIPALFISACGGTSSSPGNNSGQTIIGRLPNGSFVYVNASSYAAAIGGESTTGTIGILGGTTGYTFQLGFNPSNIVVLTQAKTVVNLPSAATSPGYCVVVAGSSLQTSCPFTISINNAESGTYDLNPFAQQITPTPVPLQQSLNPIPLTITGGGGSCVESYALYFSTKSISVAQEVDSIPPTLSHGASNITLFESGTLCGNTATAGLSATNNVTLSPSTCTFTGSTTSCTVTVAGSSSSESGASTVITATTTTESASKSISVNGAKLIQISTQYTGNLGGVSGADTKCSTQFGESYATLITNGSTRVACTSANCGTGGVSENTGWVLKPNTPYLQYNGTTLISYTNESGIFVFPTQNGIETSGGGSWIWTGLNKDWTSPSISLLCSSAGVAWENAATVASGIVGGIGATTSKLINSFTTGVPHTGCSNQFFLACVEQ